MCQGTEYEDEDEEEDGKRGATWQMLKNQGLKQHKKRVDRNPRVKKRRQYVHSVLASVLTVVLMVFVGCTRYFHYRVCRLICFLLMLDYKGQVWNTTNDVFRCY